MPGKLEINNASSSTHVVIFLWSVDGREQHLNSKTLGSGKTISAIVKGGVKMLIVATADGNIFWEGMIPSYGSVPVFIYPENRTLTYRNTVLVNTLGYTQSSVYIPMWVWILAAAMTVVMAGLYFYKRRRL